MPNAATVLRQAITPAPEGDLAGTEHARGRVTARGKFLGCGRDKFWVRGVTYGTFRPGPDGEPFPDRATVDRDFAQMVRANVNAVRVYTVPPRWLLDTADDHGLRVMVGIPWEQHVAFLDDPGRAADIVRRVRAAVRRCSGHPAILCYAIGNEIPAGIVRWHGRTRIERFLKRLYGAAKREDPTALVTYVNFPTTEYLRLPFLDLVSFNVYLETEERLAAYLARLQNLAGERPLILAELGLDSRRNGPDAQARSLHWQLRTAFAAGCAGSFVFSWTDEWHRGGSEIEDWDFGLTTRERQPKQALNAVREVFAAAPFPASVPWPRVSVVVCSYNGARTIRDTMEGLQRLDYPDFEVIVVNDGSTDATPDIVGEYEVRLVSTPNRGLSAARNTGWQHASGEIVAYIDDDAYPDPHWLQYLAHAFMTTGHDGVGGPNIAPPGDGPIADCIANAPGGPVHVLLTDTLAEHIPGCNMAFRRSALAAIGGFDPRYRAAGDDVDLCWRLMERGGTIGFHAGAMDWHHRRNSLGMYWRQQKGYGKAEALLEEKWPERYNALGHFSWSGRLYGRGFTEALPLLPTRVYHGTWGSALFQSLYERAPGVLLSLPLMPEWYLVLGLVAIMALLGTMWKPLALVGWPLLVIGIAAPVGQAIVAATRARFPENHAGQRWTLGKRTLTALLHLMQPAARLIGRLQHGLTPWRQRGAGPAVLPVYRQETVWSERWRAPEDWVRALEAEIAAENAVVLHGGNYDPWDLQVRGGLFGSVRTLVAVEEHGSGKQLVRARMWRQTPVAVRETILAGLLMTAVALLDRASAPAAGMFALTTVLIVLSWRDTARAAGAWLAAITRIRRERDVNPSSPPLR